MAIRRHVPIRAERWTASTSLTKLALSNIEEAIYVHEFSGQNADYMHKDQYNFASSKRKRKIRQVTHHELAREYLDDLPRQSSQSLRPTSSSSSISFGLNLTDPMAPSSTQSTSRRLRYVLVRVDKLATPGGSPSCTRALSTARGLDVTSHLCVEAHAHDFRVRHQEL
jgi:hypothetical protein